MDSTRILTNPDRSLLDAFLRKHADTSMIMRGNLLLEGIEDRGGRFQGPYAGAFDAAGELRAVAVHFVRGNLFAVAEDDAALDAAVRATTAASKRPVTGFIGPRRIVSRARSVLGLEAAPVQLDANESLYALELWSLRVPALLSAPGISFRALREGDRELYVAWSRDYEITGLGAADTPELTQREHAGFERTLALGERCLLTFQGEPCATSGFNARLPDSVQVGGVYTPPGLRSRGYARAVVAGTLLDARERGVTRGVLFTGDANVPAIKAYLALGFSRIGDWNITLLRP